MLQILVMSVINTFLYEKSFPDKFDDVQFEVQLEG
jgi:hypothetical protein